MELRPPPAARLSHAVEATLAALAVAVLLALASTPETAAAQDLREPESSGKPPPSYELSAREVVRIARATDEVRGELRAHPSLEATAYTSDPGRWQVSWTADGDELVQVHVDDAGASVLETWTGPQVAWRMARGYEGAFGRTLNAPYVWIPLMLLFLAPFVDPRRPFRLLHLDLLALLAFSASHVFFNRGEIFTSVPIVYPVLAYLLVRMLIAGFRPRRRPGPLVPLVPAAWLALGLVFLVGFRIALNVVDSNVIDVGYAGVIGADRIADRDPLYEGAFAADNQRGNTYGPFNYLAYLPFEQAFPWSGSWDDLPAAHGAAMTFDTLTLIGLFLLGRRLRRGREGAVLGLALAWAWATYPYALFALSSNANDTLVAMLLVYALLAIASAPGRGVLLGLAAAAKFAPLALAPLFATGTGGDGGRGGRVRSLAGFGAGLGAVGLVCALLFLPDGGVRELYDRTVGYQASRDSPFSIWGQQAWLAPVQTAVKVGALALAVLVGIVPRRRSPAQVAALGAAVLIALQLAVTHWFYLYIVWFAPFVLVALFAAHESGEWRSRTDAESRRETASAA